MLWEAGSDRQDRSSMLHFSGRDVEDALIWESSGWNAVCVRLRPVVKEAGLHVEVAHRRHIAEQASGTVIRGLMIA